MNEYIYIYDGPVMFFGNCIVSRWRAETRAVSENKARSNFEYQYKKQNNLCPSAKIDLPGEIITTRKENNDGEL